MCTDRNDTKIKKALLMQLTCERCRTHISSAQTILYLDQSEENNQRYSLDEMRHVLGLMSQELETLSSGLGGIIEG